MRKAQAMAQTTVPDLGQFIDGAALDALIAGARAEDVGPRGLDVTSAALIPAERMGRADMIPRSGGVLSGVAMLGRIAAAYDARLTVKCMASDGEAMREGRPVARLAGPMRSILAMERVALNFVTHLSGIATLTARYVAQTDNTDAHIYDTRKTLPGLRGLEKYAVACGGGKTHRIGLYDAMLVKDNHLAGVPVEELADVLRSAIQEAHRLQPALKFVAVEVDTFAQLERVLGVSGVAVALLDNMTPEELAEAVRLRDQLAPWVKLEASGGVSMKTVGAIAAAGVDRISVGALTHSAPAVDVGLDIEWDEPT